MAVTYVCDRCGYRTEDLGIVKRYMLALTPEDNGTAGAVPARSRKTAEKPSEGDSAPEESD